MFGIKMNNRTRIIALATLVGAATTYYLVQYKFIKTPLAPEYNLSFERPILPTNYDPNFIPQHKVVLQVQDTPVGFINYGVYLSSPTTAGFFSFYIEKKYRGVGNGRQLLKRSIAYLKEKGFKAITIRPGPFELDEQGHPVDLTGTEHTKAQEKLVRLYESVGFQFRDGQIDMICLL